LEPNVFFHSFGNCKIFHDSRQAGQEAVNVTDCVPKHFPSGPILFLMFALIVSFQNQQETNISLCKNYRVFQRSFKSFISVEMSISQKNLCRAFRPPMKTGYFSEGPVWLGHVFELDGSTLFFIWKKSYLPPQLFLKSNPPPHLRKTSFNCSNRLFFLPRWY
jgi:hypothetical protein